MKTGLLHVLLLRGTHMASMQSLNLPELSCGPSRKSPGTPSESHLRNRIKEGKPWNHKDRNRVNPNCFWKKTEAFSHYFPHCLKCFSLSARLRNTIMIETAQPLTTKLMGGPDHSQSSKKALTFSKTPEMLACLHPTSIDGHGDKARSVKFDPPTMHPRPIKCSYFPKQWQSKDSFASSHSCHGQHHECVANDSILYVTHVVCPNGKKCITCIPKLRNSRWLAQNCRPG